MHEIWLRGHFMDVINCVKYEQREQDRQTDELAWLVQLELRNSLSSLMHIQALAWTHNKH